MAVAVAGCSDSGPSEPEVEFQVIEEVTFDPSLDIDLAEFTELASGVYIQDVTVGTGDTLLVLGLDAEVTRTGWLTDATVIEPTVTFRFRMGTNTVVAGFERGALNMRTGGVRRIIVPPILAYGSIRVGPVPPGAILIYEVELLAID